MIIPFEQIVRDHERDVALTTEFFGEFTSRGLKMWVLATAAYDFWAAVHEVRCKDQLIVKWPGYVYKGNSHGHI